MIRPHGSAGRARPPGAALAALATLAVLAGALAAPSAAAAGASAPDARGASNASVASSADAALVPTSDAASSADAALVPNSDAAPSAGAEVAPVADAARAPGSDATVATPADARCEGLTLVLRGADGAERAVPLPAPCALVALGLRRVAVLAGDAVYAFDTGSSEADLVPVPTVGRVSALRWEGDELVLTEQISVERRARPLPTSPADASGSDAPSAGVPPAGSPPVDAPPVDAPPVDAPPVEAPASTSRSVRAAVAQDVGAVLRLQGGLAVARVEPGVLAEGDSVEVLRPARPARIAPDGGSRVRPGERERRSVVAVEGVDGDLALLRLGRGDIVGPGDRVRARAGLAPEPRRLIGPQPWRDQLAVLGEIGLGISASRFSAGAHLLGRFRLSYAAPVPLRVEVGLEQLALGLAPASPAFGGVAVAGLAEVDLAPFGVGFGGGWQGLGYYQRGPVVLGLLRGGFRDGLHIELRARILLGRGSAIGAVEGRGVVPFTQSVALTLEGGGGSNAGWARVGVQLHAAGQGGPGTVVVAPSLGMQTLSWWGLSDTGEPWSGAYFFQIGPAFAVRVELRPPRPR